MDFLITSITIISKGSVLFLWVIMLFALVEIATSHGGHVMTIFRRKHPKNAGAKASFFSLIYTICLILLFIFELLFGDYLFHVFSFLIWVFLLYLCSWVVFWIMRYIQPVDENEPYIGPDQENKYWKR